MNRLTQEERRRVYLAQQKAREDMFARLQTVPATGPAESSMDRRKILRLLKTGLIVTLLGGGVLAYHTLEFHLPASIVEVLLPRL